jgi:hypothetical protein
MLELSRRHGFRLVGHVTGPGGVRKRDPDMGVAAMAQDFITRRFVIPWHPETRARIEPLVHELRTWSPSVPAARRPQDRVMALWFAWIRARELAAAMAARPRSFARRGLYAPTRVALAGRR